MLRTPMSSRTRRTACVALLLASGTASAQDEFDGFDAHGFTLAAYDRDLRDLLVLRRPSLFSQGDLFAGALIEYAKSPLRLVEPTPRNGETRNPVVDNVLALDLSFGAAAHERLRFDVTAPLYFVSNGLDLQSVQAGSEVRGPAMGDIRATSMIMAVRPGQIPSADTFGLAVLAHIDLPSGAEGRMLGRSSVGGGAGVSATYEVDQVTVSAETSAQFDPAIENINLLGGNSLVAALGAGVLPDDRFGANLELNTRIPFTKSEGVPLGAEVLGSLRYIPNEDGTYWTFGTAAGLTNGPGVATFRLFAGGGFGRQKGEVEEEYIEIAPPSTVSLTIEAQYQGSPRAAHLSITGPSGTEQRDTGASGTTLQVAPESVWEVSATSGACLAGEGRGLASAPSSNLVIDLEPRLDAHVRVEVVGSNDAPVPSARVVWTSANPECVPGGMTPVDPGGVLENDLSSGTHHLTVTASAHTVHQEDVSFQPGDTRTIRVKLQPTLVEITRDEIKVLEKVHFDSGKAVIKPISYPLLDDVAEAILTTPDMGRIEVQGHTDSQGSDEFNMKLSQSRAESVRTYLMNKGVPENQLIARGFGETSPIDTNNTPAGREVNRRVQFARIDAQER